MRREHRKKLTALGWRLDGHTGGGHIRLVRERDGRRWQTSNTPSDTHAFDQLLRDLKRLESE